MEFTVDAAMVHAMDLARRGPEHGPNPRVGCVLLAATTETVDHPRRVLATGWHRGAGTPHAEAAALAEARDRGVDLRGATAVVTLEPCNHTGRTGPCTRALLDAGIAEVVVSVLDPNPEAAGGAALLRSHGVEVRTGVRPEEGAELVRVWAGAVRAGRPFVTVKTATSLDGRVAAADGSSRWITGPAARGHAHAVRATVDAILVGTGTLLADDPELTARTPTGDLAEHQPTRIVLGARPVPDGARLRTGHGFEQYPSHDLTALLAELHARQVRHLLVEGGPTVATAFLAAGLVDEVHAYVAPVLIGTGPHAVDDLGGRSIDQAVRLRTVEVRRLGDDMLLVARPTRSDVRSDEE